MKVNIIPRIVNKLRRCIAIVEDGDTCSISGGIASGKWIIWKGRLYQTSEAISYGSSFTVGTNLTAKDGGIGNQLQTQISELDSKLTKHGIEQDELLGSTGGTGEYTLTHSYNSSDYRYILLVAFSSAGSRIYPAMIPRNLLLASGYRLSVSVDNAGYTSIRFKDSKTVVIETNVNALRIYGIK